jgi:hypothetical protein
MSTCTLARAAAPQRRRLSEGLLRKNIPENPGLAATPERSPWIAPVTPEQHSSATPVASLCCRLSARKRPAATHNNVVDAGGLWQPPCGTAHSWPFTACMPRANHEERQAPASRPVWNQPLRSVSNPGRTERCSLGRRRSCAPQPWRVPTMFDWWNVRLIINESHPVSHNFTRWAQQCRSLYSRGTFTIKPARQVPFHECVADVIRNSNSDVTTGSCHAKPSRSVQEPALYRGASPSQGLLPRQPHNARAKTARASTSGCKHPATPGAPPSVHPCGGRFVAPHEWLMDARMQSGSDCRSCSEPAYVRLIVRGAPALQRGGGGRGAARRLRWGAGGGAASEAEGGVVKISGEEALVNGGLH